MSIPLTITLTKPAQNKYETLYYVCNDMDDCYNKIIIAINKEINYIINNENYNLKYTILKF
jgi:hypothetical protein